jgi:dihydrofolate reductase
MSAESPPTDESRLVLIAAVAENGVIGAEGGMPWHYPADLRHFKATTTGHPVIMGRRTYDSIIDGLGHPLPDRTTVVLSRQQLELPAGVMLADSVADAIAAARAAPGGSTVYVGGGASVYEQCLADADRLVITEVPGRPDGDTYFPEIDSRRWTELSRRSEGELAFVRYGRR